MEGENKVVKLWLEQQGFSLISNINAGRNNLVNFIAIKSTKTNVIAKHIQVYVSIAEQIDVNKVLSNFTDKHIKIRINKLLLKMGYDLKPKPMLILNSSLKVKAEEVEIVQFEDVFAEVLKELDKKNYQDSLVRLMQLTKYFILSDPRILGFLISNLMNLKNKEIIIKELLKTHGASVFMSKSENLKELEEVLVGSHILKPTVLARELPNLMSKRSINIFLKGLLEHEKMSDFRTKKLPQQKSLTVFLE